MSTTKSAPVKSATAASIFVPPQGKAHHEVTVRGDQLLTGIRAYASALAVDALQTGYPGKLAVITQLAKDAGYLAKNPSKIGNAIGIALGHAVTRVVPDVNFQPGDVVTLTVVSPLDEAADEFIPEVLLTAAEQEAAAVAKSIVVRDEAIAKQLAARGVAPAEGWDAKTVSDVEAKVAKEQAQAADDAANGITRATAARPWDTSGASFDKAPRSTTIRFTVADLSTVVAAFNV
jgi:hypothetical protein